MHLCVTFDPCLLPHFVVVDHLLVGSIQLVFQVVNVLLAPLDFDYFEPLYCKGEK